MSAYVVDPAIINRILSALANGRDGCGKWCLEYEYLKALKDAQGTREEREALGREMYAINIDSVCARYPDSNRLPGTIGDGEGGIVGYEYRLEESGGKCQTYKDIGCWIYQSCESEQTCNTPIYKALEIFRARVADRIINDLPEYQTATWG